MFKYLLLVLIFLAKDGLSQQVSFRGEGVKRLFIKGDVGYYDSDERCSKGAIDELEILYDTVVRRYRVARYNREEYKDCTGDSQKSRTEIKKRKTPSAFIDSKLLELFFNQLNINKGWVTDLRFIQDQWSYLLRDKEIVNERNRTRRKNQPKYKKRDFSAEYFEALRNPDSFKKYLAHFDTDTAYIVTVHVSDETQFQIETSHNTFTFEAKYPYVFRQPIYEYREHRIVPVINFNINQALLQILPADFITVEGFKLRALVRDYIRWAGSK